MSLTAWGTLSSGQQQALAGVVGDPALADREVDDVGGVAGGERVLEVVLERGLVVLPVDLDARVGRLEAGDRVLDVLVERRRQVERPEADLGVGLDALDDRLGRIGREGAGLAGAALRAPCSRRGALAGAACRGRLADGATAAGVQAADASAATSPRASSVRDSPSVAPLFDMSLPGPCVAAVTRAASGLRGSRAITSSRCAGDHLDGAWPVVRPLATSLGLAAARVVDRDGPPSARGSRRPTRRHRHRAAAAGPRRRGSASRASSDAARSSSRPRGWARGTRRRRA